MARRTRASFNRKGVLTDGEDKNRGLIRLKDANDTIYKLFPVSLSIMTVSGGILLASFLRSENAFFLFSNALNAKLFLSLIFFAMLWSLYFIILSFWTWLIRKLRLAVEIKYDKRDEKLRPKFNKWERLLFLIPHILIAILLYLIINSPSLFGVFITLFFVCPFIYYMSFYFFNMINEYKFNENNKFNLFYLNIVLYSGYILLIFLTYIQFRPTGIPRSLMTLAKNREAGYFYYLIVVFLIPFIVAVLGIVMGDSPSNVKSKELNDSPVFLITLMMLGGACIIFVCSLGAYQAHSLLRLFSANAGIGAYEISIDRKDVCILLNNGERLFYREKSPNSKSNKYLTKVHSVSFKDKITIDELSQDKKLKNGNKYIHICNAGNEQIEAKISEKLKKD